MVGCRTARYLWWHGEEINELTDFFTSSLGFSRDSGAHRNSVGYLLTDVVRALGVALNKAGST
jgi:hypothetical protein